MTAPAAKRQSVGVVGGALAVAGAVLIVLAFTVLDWFRKDSASAFNSGSKSTFSDIHDVIEKVGQQVNGSGVSDQVHVGLSKVYFGWLGWVLLIVAVVLALLAILPLGAASVVFRVLGALAALGGLGVTLSSLEFVRVDDDLRKRIETTGVKVPDFGYYIRHTSFGAWAALLGFLLLLIASVTGPRTVRTADY